jgi:hypothetical protein
MPGEHKSFNAVSRPHVRKPSFAELKGLFLTQRAESQPKIPIKIKIKMIFCREPSRRL